MGLRPAPQPAGLARISQLDPIRTQRAQTPKASHGRTAPLADRPSDHSGPGDTRVVPDGGSSPLLVAMTGVVVHGPTNEPRSPCSVVMAPCRNWLMRNAWMNGGSGIGTPVLLVKSSTASAYWKIAP